MQTQTLLKFWLSIKENNTETNDLAQYKLRYKMTFNCHGIILGQIIDQLIIVFVQQDCHDKQSNANSMVKIYKTIAIK